MFANRRRIALNRRARSARVVGSRRARRLAMVARGADLILSLAGSR